MRRVLLAGGTGFIGANLVRRLLGEGHKVHLLVRRGYAPWRIEEVREVLHLHEVSLTDGDMLKETVSKIRPEWVFHLAVQGAYAWQTDWREMVRTNFLGAVNLVEACLAADVEVLVNTGSSSEYGFKDHAPSEDEYLDPNSYYAVTKASATLFCRYTAKVYGMRIPTLRLYSVYGPYEDPRRLIPTLILKGLDGELPALVQSDVARDFVYVDDVTEAYILAAREPKQEPGAIYNVGTGVQTTLKELVAVVRRLMRIAREPEWGSMPNREWDTAQWVADNRKIVHQLGWQPRYTLEEGLRTATEWFLSRPTLCQQYRERQRNAR